MAECFLYNYRCNLPLWLSDYRTRPPCAVEHDTLSGLVHYEQILVKIVVLEMGVGHFECKFQEEARGRVVQQQILASEN